MSLWETKLWLRGVTVVLLLVLLFLARDEILTEADVQQFEEFFKSKGLKLLHQNVRGVNHCEKSRTYFWKSREIMRNREKS